MSRILRSKAIRLKCLDCCNNVPGEVLKCTCNDCPLFNYRMGYETDSNGNKVSKQKKEED